MRHLRLDTTTLIAYARGSFDITSLDDDDDDVALAHVRRTGVSCGAHDLIIAAHAAQTGRALMSLDAKAKFAGLPGVTAPGGPHPA